MKKHVLLFVVLFLGAWVTTFAQTFNVVFKVDMSVQIKKGTFNPAADKIQAKGDFNSWGATDMAKLAAPQDSIYSATIACAAGVAHYKFYFKHGTTDVWESDQAATASHNRETNITAAVTLPKVWFNDEVMPSGHAAAVTFKIDMRIPFKQKLLTTGHVYIAGDLNGWSTTANALAGPAADSTYSATISINSAQLIHWKVLYGDKNGNTQWEGSFSTTSTNREDWIVDGPQNISKFWNDTDPSVTLKDGALTFQVDMSTMYELRMYNPATDSLRIRGSFNGWGDGDKSRAFMNQDPLSPNNFFLSVGFVAEKVTADELYKFRMAKKTVTGIWAVAGGDAQYERPFSTGGGNRVTQFAGQNNQFTVPATLYFNDIYPAFVIPSGKTITVNFAVDMSNALDPAKVPITFDPAVDTVYLVCGQSAWAAAMGGNGTNVWKEDGDRVLKLAKSTGNIWIGSITVGAGGFNGFMYTYEFGHKADGTLQKEGTGFSNWARRVRYVPMTGSRAFVQPYTAKVDQWTRDEVKPSTEYELWPTGLSDVQDLGTGIPTTFDLKQNYPNPFNPTTTIRFSLPSDELVSLKIYNVLGQQVETLINKSMRAGSYNVDFNASKLSSGVYFYRIEAGNYNITKKMLLLK
ncbi:MAG: T9SS type A sorting domain-containing protein [Ignavibacteriales bacterium]|nr:T9SS type A sorting domain-containing protein [Ignavibacteriales bacterium]